MNRRSDNAILTALFLATAISIVLAVILNMPGEELAMHGVDNQPAQAAQAAQATEIRNIVELLQPTPTRVPSSTPTPRPRQTHEPTETPLPTFALGGTPEPGLYRIVPPTQTYTVIGRPDCAEAIKTPVSVICEVRETPVREAQISK